MKIRNRPPSSRIRSLPDSDSGPRLTMGVVSVAIQEITVSRPRRMNSARLRPMILALSR
ncbi:hypothetical protein D3C71_1873460 [compost metagenome]